MANPNTKNKNENNPKENSIKDISRVYKQAMLEAYKGYSSLNQMEKTKYNLNKALTGQEKDREQFWNYFQRYYGKNFLESIDKKHFNIQFDMIKREGFELKDLDQKLQESIKPDDEEQNVIEQALSNFKTICKKSSGIPDHVFDDFASSVNGGFDKKNCTISPDSNIKNVEDLLDVWNNYKRNIVPALSKEQDQRIQSILTPDFDNTEKTLIFASIQKFQDTLPGKLQDDFKKLFPQTLNDINAFSPIRHLLDFKNKLEEFLADNASKIDEDLAKKLNQIIITNGDIRKVLSNAGLLKNQDIAGSFSEWNLKYKLMFSNLVYNQLYDKIEDEQKLYDIAVDNLVNTFKKFPPYVNALFQAYPYRQDEVAKIVPEVIDKIKSVESELDVIYNKLNDNNISKEERNNLEIEKKVKNKIIEEIKRNAYIKFLENKNPEIANILQELVNNNFDFSKLNESQKQKITNILVEENLDEIVEQDVPYMLDIDQNEFKEFIKDMFDLNKKTITIPGRYGDITLDVEKSFMGGPIEHFTKVQDIAKLRNLPLNFKVSITKQNEHFFEENPIFQKLFFEFNGHNDKVKFNESYKVKLTKNDKEYEGYLSPVAPDGIDSEGDELYLYSTPINTVSSNRILVTDPKTGPIVVKKDNVKGGFDKESDYNIQILKKELNLNGEAIGLLLFGYTVGRTYTDPNIKQLGEGISKIETYKDINENELQEDEIEEQMETSEKPTEKTPDEVEKENYENFIEEWSKIGGYDFANDKENKGFEKGTRLIFKLGYSELPPMEVGSQLGQIEITKVDLDKNFFEIKFSGGELSLGNIEGLTKKLPIKQSSIQKLVELFKGDVWKLPNPQEQSKEFFDCLEEVKQTGDTLGGSGYGIFDSLSLNGSGFVNNDGEEIQYFGTTHEEFSPEGNRKIPKESVIHDLYQVSHNKGNNTFKVTYKSDDSPSKWKREMDYNQFILFCSQKGLKPKTDEDIKEIKVEINEKEKQLFKTGFKTKWFSVNNMVEFFKTEKNRIVDGIKKKDKERAEDMSIMLVERAGIYKKLGNFVGLFGFNQTAEAFDEMHSEYEKDKDKRIWEKIEKWVKVFENHHHFDTQFKVTIRDIANGKVPQKDRYKVAAALLVLLKKGGPYQKALQHLNGTGHWVNMILGEKHLKRFKMEQAKMKAIVEKESGNNQEYHMDRLNQFEFKYIVDIIDGREFILDGKEETRQASRWSRQFAEELESRYTEYYDYKKVDSKANELPGNMSFERAQYEYHRFIVSGREHKALPYLRKMADAAKFPKQQSLFKMYVMAGIMTGHFLHMTDLMTRKYVQNICRTVGFQPGMLTRNIKQQDFMVRILDMATDGKFSKDFKYGEKKDEKTGKIIKEGKKYNISNFGLGKMGDTEEFVKDFAAWWVKGDENGNTNGKTIEGFLKYEGVDSNESKFLNKLSDEETPDEDKKVLEELRRLNTEKTKESIDSTVMYNYDFYQENPLNTNKALVQDLLSAGGAFKGDGGQVEAAEEFWKKATNAIPTQRVDKASLDFVLRVFFNRFDGKPFTESKTAYFVRAIPMLKEHKIKSPEEADSMLWYLIHGNIISGLNGLPSELDSAVSRFYRFFSANLDQIDNEVLTNVLGENFIDTYNDPYNKALKVHDRDKYNLLKETKGGGQEIAKLREKYNKQEEYVNKTLVDLKDRLVKNYGINVPSLGKSKEAQGYTDDTSTDYGQKHGHNPIGIKMSNPEILEILEKKRETKEVNQYYGSLLEGEDDEDDDY